MAQFARPASDVTVGGWSPTPLWQQVDEATRSDADRVTSDDNTAPDVCEIALSALEDPQSSGSHVIRYAYRKNDTLGHSINVTVRLMDGTSEVASWTHSDVLGITWEEATQTLTATETDAIGDYANLRVRLERSGDTGGNPGGRRSAQVSWVEFETPDAPAVVPSGGSTAPVSAAAAGSGGKASDGGSGAAAGILAGSGGLKTSDDGTTATVSVVAAGGGGTVTATPEGGADATATVVGSGFGSKVASDGAGSAVSATGAGAGDRTATSGATATVTVTASGAGQAVVPNGGGASITVPTATIGAGAKAARGGDGTFTHVSTTSAGTKVCGGAGHGTVVVATAGGGAVVAAAADRMAPAERTTPVTADPRNHTTGTDPRTTTVERENR